jgi:hypothetical protein
MFWKNRKEKKKLLDEYVDFTDVQMNRIDDEVRWMLYPNRFTLPDGSSLKDIDKFSLDSYKERIREMKAKFIDYVDAEVKRAKKYKEARIANKAALEEIHKNGCPLFIVAEPIHDYFTIEKKYLMCYEFQKSEKEGYYNVYEFSGDDAYGHVIPINYDCYSIREMTEWEFYEHYLIGRLSQRNFRNEEDAIEYDNYLRRLFHDQWGG